MAAPEPNLMSVVNPDRIIESLKPLINRLPVAALQDRLAAAGFIDSSGERDARQRACDSPIRFWEMIGHKLKSAEGNEAALHVLRRIVLDCVQLDKFPPPATRALRRAQQALEQSDVGAVMRALGSLDAFQETPGLSSPRVLLYVLARTESGRQLMVRLTRIRDLSSMANLQAARPFSGAAATTAASRAGSATTQGTPSAKSDVPHGRTKAPSSPRAVTTADRNAGPKPAALPLRSAPVPIDTSPSPFRDRLARLRTPSEHPKLNWDLEAKRTKLQPASLDLDLQAVDNLIDQTATLFAAGAEALAPTPPGERHAGSLKGKLQRIADLGAEANKCAGALTQLIAQFRSVIQAMHSTLPASAQLRAAAAVRRVSADETFFEGIREFQQACHEWRGEQIDRIAQAYRLALDLQQLAADILPKERERLQHIVIGLFETLSLDDLDRLRKATVARAEDCRRRNGQRAEAASEVLQWLDEHRGTALTDGDRADILRLLEAVEIEELRKKLASLLPVEQTPPVSPPAPAQEETVAPESPIAQTIEPEEPVPAPPPQPIIVEWKLPTISGTMPVLVPRDRLTARDGLPAVLSDSCVRLMTRAVEELDRGSVIGVLDHALDLLAAIADAGGGREEWFHAVVALLASIPAAPPFDGEWGHSAAVEFQQRLCRAMPALEQTLSAVLQEPRADDVISERFFYKEFLPFASELGTTLCRVAGALSPHALEDVASAVGRGSVIGDPAVALAVLTSLAETAGLQGQLPVLYEDARRSKRLTGKVTKPPILTDWIWEALHQIVNSGDRPNVIRKAASAFHLIVIPSVSRSGGLPYSPSASLLDMVFYINLLQEPGVGPVELAIPQQRNPWLTTDHVCYLGPLEPSSPVVVPIRAELAKALDPNGRLQILYQLSFKELGAGDTRIYDDKYQPAISEPKPVEITGYSGASGFPLTLTGDTLKLSSASVRNTLKKISAGLKAGPLAALIVGRRRRGKTSILQTICQDPEIKAKYQIVFDKFDSVPAVSVGEAMHRLGMNLDKLGRRLDLKLDPIQDHIGFQPNIASAIVQEWLEAVTDALPGPAFGLILIDEFQKWLSRLLPEGRAQVLLLLRALMNRPHSERFGISVILSGLSDLKEYTKASADFKAFFPMYRIESFAAEESAALLRSNPTVDYDVRAMRLVHELSGGNPYLVNLLGDEITTYLQELGRSYCLASDVENVVQGELADKSNSRVWSFVEYLLRQGEEDQAAMIEELPAVEALAWALRQRGTRRPTMRLQELQGYLVRAGAACNEVELERMLQRAADNELLEKSDRGYAFASRWVGEWLSASATDHPRGITATRDPSLVLNHYRRIEKLSTQGAQAEVWRAEDIRYPNSQCLLKIYPRRFSTHTPAVVQREVAALRQVNHQGVVKCLFNGVDEEKGDVLVLEWVEARSLRELICNPDAMAEKLIGPSGDRDVQLKFLEQLAAALAHCHDRGIVHKDLKPENILVTDWVGILSPKIIDFGLASQPIQPDGSQGTLGPYTQNYVAPERLRGESRKSAADVFSLGVVFYELLAGVLPYPQVILQASARTIVPIAERRPNIGVKIAELVHSMLAEDPAARPTASYVAAALPAAAIARDWKECRDAAVKVVIEEDDYERALAWYMKAVACTPAQERTSSEFALLLRETLDAAVAVGRTSEYLSQLVQPALQAICRGQHKAGGGFENHFDHLGQKLMDCILSPASLSYVNPDGHGEAIRYLVDLLSESGPSRQLGSLLSRLLDGMDRLVIWASRHTLFDVAVRHRLESTISDHVVYRWCLKAASRCRQISGGSLVECAVWLRRAERLGASNSAEFKHEAAELVRLTSKTAESSAPPPVAEQVSPDKCIGDGERGHCNVDRFRRWVSRMQRRFDFVERAVRVEGDRNIDPRPCRMLDPDKAAQHFTKVLPKDRARVIAAVLDESYHSAGIALRINIWLAPGCTVAQRDHAIELLKTDTELFGDAAS